MVIIWVFVVLILTSSYTASLTSMLTVQQLHPTVSNLQELARKGDYVMFEDYSVLRKYRSINIDSTQIRDVEETAEKLDEALTEGSSNGGVGAIILEIPYIKIFLSKYCGKYTMVGDVYRTDGFGFVSIANPFMPLSF